MSDLKPCPFCGSEATHDTNGSEIWVICKKCGARCLSTCFSGKKGVQIVNERWNRRVPKEQQMLVLSPDLTPEQVKDIFDKFASSQQTKPNDYCKDCKHCEEHYYHGDDSYVYYCQYWKSFTQPHDHCPQWGK